MNLSPPEIAAPSPGVLELPGLSARYRPERLLSRGARHSVFLARDTERDRWVAVSMFDTRSLPPDEVERRRRVPVLAGSGAHPHVLPIDHVSESEGHLFMVSPFLVGGDLRRRIEEGGGRPLPLTEVLRIGSQVARALESVHAAGISHRDVKPGNVLLDERGDAQLADFDMAVDADCTLDRRVTGTPAYLAPEQITSSSRAPMADLYSLGCLLYELTTGRPPFIGEHASEVLRQHEAARPVPPVERNPDVPMILNHLILALLEKRPEARPASAGDVRAALEGLLRGAPPARRAESHAVDRRRHAALELPFVGRARELAALDASLSRVFQAQPGLLLITGDAGSGKSRLLSELLARAEERRCAVLIGKGDEGGTTSFQPFVDAMLPLAAHLSEIAPIHAELLRDFLYREHRAELALLTPRGGDRERLFASVLALLSEFARERAVVILLEDLHAFDRASLELFEHLALALSESAARRDLAVLVAATTRPSFDERLASLQGTLRTTIGCETLELGPLDESAVFELLTALAGRRPTVRRVHEVMRATDGNPLFVGEAVHRLRDAGQLDASGAERSMAPEDVELLLPDSVSRAIEERIDQLGADCRERLTLGALLGTRFERGRLARVSGGREDDLALVLEEAVAQGLLIESGAAYAFAHPLIRQGVRDRLAPSELDSLHFRIARRLLDVPDVDPLARAFEAAHHLVRSGPLAEPTELARIAGQAGEQALARFAWHESAELLEVAIDAAQRGARLGARERAELHRNAGLAYFRMMDAKACMSHYDAAIAYFERAGDALNTARALNDRAVAGVLKSSYGQPGELEPLERALALLDPAETALRAQILMTLALSLWNARQPDRAEQCGVEALELANREGNHGLCAEVSVELGTARFGAMRVEDALAAWQTGAEHARQASDLLPEQRCLARSSMAFVATARLDEALEAIRAAQGMHHVLQQYGEMSIASGMLVAVSAIRGDLEAAERHAADALDRVRRVGFAWGTLLCLPALACARAHRSDVAGARRAILRMFEPGLGFADPSAYETTARCFEWVAHWYAGDAEAIDPRKVRAVTGELGGSVDQRAGTLACALVELADALQAPDLAESATEVLEAAIRHGFVFWNPWPFFLPRLRGVAAALTGSFELAEQHFDAAIEIAARVGATSEHARSQLDLARLLATRNATGDRPRALSLLSECRPVLAACGPAAFSERADRLDAFLFGEAHIHSGGNHD